MLKKVKKTLASILALGMIISTFPISAGAEGVTAESSLERYAVDNEKMTITMPDTTIAKLKSVVTGSDGSQITVKDENGAEVTEGYVTGKMSMVVGDNEYDIKIKNTVAYDLTDRLENVDEDTLLFEAKVDSSSKVTVTQIYGAEDVASANSMYGLHNNSGVGYVAFGKTFPKATPKEITYQATRKVIPGSNIPAYFFDTIKDTSSAARGWVMHTSNALGLQGNTSADKGDKTIISFNLHFGENAAFSFWPMHYAEGGGGYELQLNNSVNKGTSDRITFRNNDYKIYLGGERRDYDWGVSSGSGSNWEIISSYAKNSRFDITLVETRTATSVTTEAVYVNGTNVLTSPRTITISDGRTYTGIRDIAFSSIGDVYFGGLTIQMADNYDPTKPAEEPEESEDPEDPEEPVDPEPEEPEGPATLGSSLERYVIDEEKMTITMPDTTVAKLKSVVKWSDGTQVKVIDENGEEVTEGYITGKMSVDAGEDLVFDIKIKNTVAYDLTDRLENVATGTSLFDATVDSSNKVTVTQVYGAEDVASANSMYGLHNNSGVGYVNFGKTFPKSTPSKITYNATRDVIPDSDIPAYRFDTIKDASDSARGWLMHVSNALGLQDNTNSATKGDKTIISFNIHFGDNAAFSFWPMHYAEGGGGYELQPANSTNKGTSDRITFKNTDYKIYLGGERRDYDWGTSDGSNCEAISTYAKNSRFDITIVESRTATSVVTEAVYVNGTNVLTSPKTITIGDGRTYTGIRDIAFASIGDLYFGGLTITMADNYDPTKPAEEPDPEDILPRIESSLERYVINEEKKTITMPDTTVAKLKSVITSPNGTVVTVVDAEGNEVTEGSMYTALKVVASKNDVENVYDIIIKNTVAFNLTERLKNVPDDTSLFEGGVDADSKIAVTKIYEQRTSNSLFGIHDFTGNRVQFGRAFSGAKPVNLDYNITKTTMPTSKDVPAYHISTTEKEGAGQGWFMHVHDESNGKALSLHENTGADKGDLTIINFKVYLGEKGGFAFWPMHYNSQDGKGYDVQPMNSTNTGTSDRIIFNSNTDTILGSERNKYEWKTSGSGSYAETIFTHEKGKEYDVTIVEKRDTAASGNPRILIDAIYVNGENILTNGRKAIEIKDGKDYSAIEAFGFATIREAYFGGLTITMADDYNPNRPKDFELADLAITTESEKLVISDGRISGWENMIASELKAAIDSSINTTVSILNAEGTDEVSDDALLTKGMILKVCDKNYASNYANYVLVEENTDTGVFFQIANGKIIAKRDVTIYTPVELVKKTLLFGSYINNETELSEFNSQTHNIADANTYSFSVELNYDATKTYKVFVWDLDVLKPLEDVVVYEAE